MNLPNKERGLYIFRIVYVLFGSITSQSICCHLKLFCGIPKAHEAQNPKDDSNGFGTDILHRPNIYRLAVVTKPITKIDPFNIKFTELLATCGARYENVQEGVFNVPMTPILTFDACD